jgi:hypothetical protein
MIWVKLGSWIPLTSNSTISKWICGEGPCSDKKKRMRKYRCYRPWKKWGENTSHTYTTKYKYISIYIYVNIYICVYKWIYIYMYKQKQINKYVYIYIICISYMMIHAHIPNKKSNQSSLHLMISKSQVLPWGLLPCHAGHAVVHSQWNLLFPVNVLLFISVLLCKHLRSFEIGQHLAKQGVGS